MTDLSERIKSLAAGNPRLIIAIDGRAAAGKTTLAKKLAEELKACVVHADDFFLPPFLRTPERYQEPGGNIHYERLKILTDSLKNGRDEEYGIFNCSKMKITENKTVPKNGTVIIEGSYSTHPYLGRYYDLSIFMDIEPEEQKRRLSLRAPESINDFTSKWIPLEEAYFEHFGIKEKCDIVIK